MDAELAGLLGAALLLGFVGSGHCLGMCGGIAGALGLRADGASRGSGPGIALLHSIGRVGTYALIGALVGAVGHWAGRALGVGPFLRVFAGVLIVLLGARAMGFELGLDRLERLGLGVWKKLAPWTARIGPPDRAWKHVALGAIWGWLPCGLVYSAAAAATATGSPTRSALFMACFGLGTLPAMVAASSAAAGLADVMRRRGARQLAGAMMIVMGAFSIAGGVAGAMHAAHGGGPAEEAPGHTMPHASMGEVASPPAAMPHLH